MMAAHVESRRARRHPAPTTSIYPKAPPVEAVRLGMYALVRLGAYRPLASVLTDAAASRSAAGGRSRMRSGASAIRRPARSCSRCFRATARSRARLRRAASAPSRRRAPSRRSWRFWATPSEVVDVRIEAARALADLGATQAADALAGILTTPDARSEPASRGGDRARAAAIAARHRALRRSRDRAVAVDARGGADRRWRAPTRTRFSPCSPGSIRIRTGACARRWRPRWARWTPSARGPRLTVDAATTAISASFRRCSARWWRSGAPTPKRVLVERLDAEDPRRAAGGGDRAGAAEGARRRQRRSLQAYERAEKDPTYAARAAILAALVELDRGRGAAAARTRAGRSRLGGARARGHAAQDARSGRRPVEDATGAGGGLAELNDLPALMQSDRLADGLHRHREGHDSDRAGGARRAARGGQLRRRSRAATSSARRRFTASSRTSWCRTAIRAATAKAGRATRFATRSISGRICAARSAWRSTGKTPAAASSSSRTSPQPHLDGRYTVFGRVVVGHGGRRSADAVGSDSIGADVGRRELDRRAR